MDDPALVGVAKGFGHLGSQAQGQGDGQGSLPVQQTAQVLSLGPFHDQTGAELRLFPVVQESYYAGVFQGGDDPGLVTHPGQELRVRGERAEEELDGHLSILAFGDGREDRPHPSLTQTLADLVAADGPSLKLEHH
jgi:hypothetical protein